MGRTPLQNPLPTRHRLTPRHTFCPISLTCSCGREGHIEAFCSGFGIAAWYESRRTERDPAVENGLQLQELAASGNELAAKCFTESGQAIGEAVASLANCVDPSVIVLSGSMTRSGQAWWDAVKEGYVKCAMNSVAKVQILPGTLSGDAPLLGAALNYLKQRDGAVCVD